MTREELIERAAEGLLRLRGFGFYDNPMEGGQDAYDITTEALTEAKLVVNIVLEEAAKVAEETPPIPAIKIKFHACSPAEIAKRIRALKGE